MVRTPVKTSLFVRLLVCREVQHCHGDEMLSKLSVCWSGAAIATSIVSSLSDFILGVFPLLLRFHTLVLGIQCITIILVSISSTGFTLKFLDVFNVENAHGCLSQHCKLLLSDDLTFRLKANFVAVYKWRYLLYIMYT